MKNLIVNIKKIAIAMLLLSIASQTKAQLTPFQSMYFQNPYLYNPAMAGMTNNLNINFDYRQQWSSFPGAPKTEAFTADFQPAEKVGLGLNLYNDVAGLITQTRIMGSYAYHLPVGGDNQKLNFGISFGVNSSKVNANNVNGDASDGELQKYNELKPYLDGDLGVAYTSNGFNISGVIPNLNATFFKNSIERFDADRLVFIAIASYKVPFSNANGTFTLQPLAGYRVVKGYNNIFDAGFNFDMQDLGIYLESIYHTNKSTSLGLGIDRGLYAFNFSYNLESGQIANYANGAFEVGIKLRLFKKQEGQ